MKIILSKDEVTQALGYYLKNSRKIKDRIIKFDFMYNNFGLTCVEVNIENGKGGTESDS